MKSRRVLGDKSSTTRKLKYFSSSKKNRVLLYSISAILILVIGLIVFFYFSKSGEKAIPLFSPHCDFNFHDCRSLDQKGATYCISGLYGPLVVDESSLLSDNSCINFQADNITLWCLNDNGEMIISPEESIKDREDIRGINIIDRSGIKINGCNLEYWNNSGIYMSGVTNSEFSRISSSNAHNGLYLFHSNFNNFTNLNLENNVRGVVLAASNDNKIIGSIETSISFNIDSGIEIERSSGNIIKNVTFVGNTIGVNIRESNSNILDNNILNNNFLGSYIWGMNNNFTNNIIENSEVNSVGLNIETTGTLGNLFYNNKFKNFNNFDLDTQWSFILQNNKFNLAKSKKTNIIGGLFSGGNFWGDQDGYGWSQYAADCNDSDGDGVCNKPYISLDGLTIDQFPLSSNPIWTGCNQRLKTHFDGTSLSENDDETYCLENSINLTGSLPFLEINNVDRIIVDCKGYRIYTQLGTNYGKAIKINGGKNITIKNCYFDNLYSSSLSLESYNNNPNAYGIYATSSDGLNISKVTIRNITNGQAIYIKDSNSVLLSDINIRDIHNASGIFLANSRKSSLKNIVVENCNKSGLYLYNGFNHGVISNFIFKNNSIGIQSEGTASAGSLFNTITSSGNKIGIDLTSVTNFSFENIEVYDNNESGINLGGVTKSRFNKITSRNNGLEGVSLSQSSQENIFTNLSALNNFANGVKLMGSSNNNTFLDSKFNSNHESGIYLVLSNNNKIINSTIESNNNSGIFLAVSNSNTIFGVISRLNGDGISIKSSQENNISNSDFVNNINAGAEIYGGSVDNNRLVKLNLKRNKIGIIINSSNNNLINSSNIEDNTNYGLLLTGANGNSIFDNQIRSNNGVSGIFLDCSANGCTDNLIYNNYFWNTKNALIIGSGENFWNTTYDSERINIYSFTGYGGNFWSDYSQSCNNTNLPSDNICDQPYNVNGSNNNLDNNAIAQFSTAPECYILNDLGVLDKGYNCYKLNASVLINSGNFFNITGQNITLDCQNKFIDGNNSASIGINVLNSGVKIKNCKIYNFSTGIISNSGGVSIENSELRGNGQGISLSSNFNTISGTNVVNSLRDAISISGNNNTLSSVIISGTNSSYDLKLENSANTAILTSSIPKSYIQSDKIRFSNGFGEISFLSSVSGELYLNEEIKFTANSLQINHSNPNIMSKPAIITLLGVSAANPRYLLRENVDCNATTSPSCILSTSMSGFSISFSTSATGDFKIGGYTLTMLEPADEDRKPGNRTNFAFKVSLLPGRSIDNCTLFINDNIEKVFNSSEVIDGVQTDYRYNFVDRGVYFWNLTCIDSGGQMLKDSNWFNATVSSNNNNNNQNNNNNNNANRACSSISGAIICAADKTCSGTWVNASGTNRCCVGTCITPSTTETCAQKSGIICTSEQTCSTSFIVTSDSARCCVGTCAIIVVNTGDGTTSDCDFMCKINKFFENKTNLIVTLVVIGIIILLIIIVFVYSFKNKKNTDRIRIFQDQQKPSFGTSYSPIQPRPVSLPTRPVQTPPAIQHKPNDDSRQNAIAINAARLSLRNYILKEMKKGVSESDLKEVLSKANWKESEINFALNDVKKFMNKGSGNKN